MIEFFNPFTKTTFGVADDRVDEYKAAGFTPVANLEKPKAEVKKVEAPKVAEVETEEEPKAVKKTTVRKTTVRKK